MVYLWEKDFLVFFFVQVLFLVCLPMARCCCHGHAVVLYSIVVLIYIPCWLIILSFFKFFFFLRAIPMAYGSSQARGQIGATAASLHHSHSNTRSQPHLQSTLHHMATLDPWPTAQGQGLNLRPHGHLLGSLLLSHNGSSYFFIFNDRHSNRCDVIFNCGFDLRLPGD